MNQTRYFVTIALLCLAQILAGNYLYLSQYIVLSLLPLVVMSLPIRYSTNFALGLAFLAGLLVDFLSSGILGISSCSLLLLALLRIPILNLVSGEEVLTHKDSAPTGHQSGRAVFLTMLLGSLVFFIPYVFVDAAGTRPFWFNVTRIVLSSALSAALMAFLNSFLFRER